MLNEMYVLDLNAQVEMNAQIKAFEKRNEEQRRQICLQSKDHHREESTATKQKRYTDFAAHLYLM